ncbi:MAG: DUF72 domain-containing protein [Bacteroidota bacterium]
MKLYIGCSGFHYSDWRNKFYPEKLPKKEWLGYYSQHFNTVEINNTFYKMPQEKTFREWMDKTPSDFKFTIKANRYFTHQKKLNVDDDFRDSFYSFDETIKSLGSKLGCVLWQLPGNLHKNEEKLESLLKLLDARTHHVLEFRHESWFEQAVYELLKKHKISYCMLSAPGKLPEDIVSTAKTAYLRFHGKSSWYNYHYSENELESWHNRLMKMKGVDRLYIYFNNDHNAWAVENARELIKMFS